MANEIDPRIRAALEPLGFTVVSQQELAKFKETKGSMRYDADDKFGDVDVNNVYVRKIAFRELGDFPEGITNLVLVRKAGGAAAT